MTQERRTALSLLVDARALHLGGIGRYLREILISLLAAPLTDQVTLLGEVAPLQAFVAAHPSPNRLEVIAHHGRLYSLRSQASWLRLRLTGAATTDVAFFPHWDAPVLAQARHTVVTVHDLTHFRVPEIFPPLRRAAAKVVFRRVVAAATRIIVDSDFTRRDLLDLEPHTAGKVRVVPLGVGPEFRPPGADEPLPPSVRVPFLLCVGNKKPHKNLATAVEVLARLLPAWPDLKLVVAGRPYPGWSAVLAGADSRGIRNAIVDLAVVTDDELRVLYGHCAALLFPSRYEGFGFPVLEAMACGAPVVASNAASIPEVAGEAALLYQPDDAAGMAEGVRRLMSDLPFRNAVTRQGRAQAATFTWERTARLTAEILQEAMTS